MTEPALFGSYELLDRIAEGGMAEVWRARSRGVAGFEKTVVIKRVLPALMANPGFAELLVREAKIAALLNHPNIVQIFDLGEQDGAYFIAMEYLEGRDLGAAMAYKPPRGKDFEGLSLPLRLWIISETAKALDYAHRRKGEDGRPMNIVHRDISPQNVLLGFEGAVKVADFGIARADERGLGRGEDPKVLRGKYAYMSPEQARGEHLDKRSDLFSLGIVLWELVVRKRLFRAGSTKETLARVRAAEVPSFDAKALDVPEALTGILNRALALDRDSRYPTAAAIHADLRQLLYEMGGHVGEPDLADVMERMFPVEDDSAPNKLRVDLMMRAYDDATSVSSADMVDDTVVTTMSGTGEHTHAFPASRRLRSEQRRVAVLAALERPGEAPAFEAAVTSVGGFCMPPLDGLREAVFGHATPGVNAFEHAARAAVELRRQLTVEGPARLDPVPSMAVVSGDATVFEAGLVEPLESTHQRCVEMVGSGRPGDVRVTEELRAELSRTFVISPAPGALITGFRARSEADALALRRRGPLAGRRPEIQKLTEAVVDAAEHRTARGFLIVGEVGSGKSRLLAELRAVAAPQNVLFVRGGGDSGNADRTFAVLADLFRDLCGVEAGDGPGQRFEKVGRLRVLGLTPRQVRLVGELLGLNYPVAREERLGRPRGIELVLSARRALRALAQDRPVVLALEDLHWMDDSTRQLLPLLVRGLARSRIVTVMTARFGMPMPVPEAEVLALSPLAPAPAGRLFASCIGARAVEDELSSRIEEETAGNPAWIGAMADALEEQATIEVADGVARVSAVHRVPVSERMRGLVVARLAELRPEDRDVVRAAAAFDGPVQTRTLAAVRGVPKDVADNALRRLMVQRVLLPAGDMEVAEWPPRTWWPGAGAWGGGGAELDVADVVRVPGALVRRTVLDLLGNTERKRLHGSIAAVLEREGAGAEDSRVEELAHHAALSVDRRRAPDYLVRAAEAARRRRDPQGAARHMASASRILREDDGEAGQERAVDLALRAVELGLDAGDRHLAEEVLADIEGATAARADRPTRVRLALASARTAAVRDDWEAARAALDEVSDCIDDLEDPVLKARALLALGTGEHEGGRCERAATLFRAAAEALEDQDADALRGRALCARATALAWNGSLEDAEVVVSAAMALTARSGHHELRYLSLAALAEVEDARGRHAAAGARFREAAEVAGDEGAMDQAARLSAMAAVAFVEAGDETRAVPIAEAAVRVSRSQRLEAVFALGGAIQSLLAVSAHPDPGYIQALVRTVDRLTELGRTAYAARALQMLAEANLRLDDPGAAARTFERAGEAARSAGHSVLAVRMARRAAETEPASAP